MSLVVVGLREGGEKCGGKVPPPTATATEVVRGWELYGWKEGGS